MEFKEEPRFVNHTNFGGTNNILISDLDFHTVLTKDSLQTSTKFDHPFINRRNI